MNKLVLFPFWWSPILYCNLVSLFPACHQQPETVISELQDGLEVLIKKILTLKAVIRITLPDENQKQDELYRIS